MFVVRYIALTALVVSLGGTILRLAHMLDSARMASFDVVTAVCGAIIVACLIVVKFIGPPPRAFTIRASLAFLMTAVALYSVVMRHAFAWNPMVIVSLGLVLLAWYAVE